MISLQLHLSPRKYNMWTRRRLREPSRLQFRVSMVRPQGATLATTSSFTSLYSLATGHDIGTQQTPC